MFVSQGNKIINSKIIHKVKEGTDTSFVNVIILNCLCSGKDTGVDIYIVTCSG